MRINRVLGHSKIPAHQYLGSFDFEIQRAIYALPIFEIIRFKDTPARAICELPVRMSSSMVKRLILTKMKSKSSEGQLLCSTIANAVDLLRESDQIKESERRVYEEALAGQAASNLPLLQIVVRLGQPPVPDSSLIINDALSAAILLNRVAPVKALLRMGADAIVKSPIFGLPLHMLARNGSLNTVRLVLDNEAVLSSQHATRLVRHKMRRVLGQAAALYGRMDIIRVLLEERYSTGQPGRGFSGAITKAIEHNHDDIAALLLQHRIPYPADEKPRKKNDEYAFWYHLASTCVNHNAESILRIVLDSRREDQGNWLQLPLQVARKNGLRRLVKMMEEHLGHKRLA